MSIAASETCETQAAIAERIGLDRTAMTYLIDGLESHKLVKRIPDTEDRRARHVALTARGRTVLAEMTERVEHIERSVLAGLRLVDNGSNSVDVCPASDTDVIKPSASRV
jgi:DNA-binding MarR family transcriptional regulator